MNSIKLVDKTREYLNYIDEHLRNVGTAWEWVQEACADLPHLQNEGIRKRLNQMISNHDISKLSKEEFVPYRQIFYPISGECVLSQSEKDAIYNIHYVKNDHHWQTIKHRYLNNQLNLVEAEIRCIHMVVDWIAMGLPEGNSDALTYFNDMKERMELPKALEDFTQVLLDRCYPLEDWVQETKIIT